MTSEDILILAARRTAIGSLQGQFASMQAHQLGAAAIAAAVADSGVQAGDIDECLMGTVLPAGQGQAPARQACLGAELPNSVRCTTVNKVCGSGMKTVMMAHDAIAAGSSRCVVAGGMESMTNAPYLLPGARAGYRMGHQQTLDHMFYDGLQNPYDNKMMGEFAELCVSKHAFSREQQDELAASSVTRSMAAIATGAFKAEICDVVVKNRKSTDIVNQDEEPGRMNLERISQLRPAFKRDGGSVTAANSSKISDGAAALVIADGSYAQQHSLKPLAKIVAHTSFAQEPEWFTTAPVGAINALLEKTGWNRDSVDLWEINEAFAVVTLAAIEALKLNPEKVNINGGACAMGHPIGASGARILVTLIHALMQHGKTRGVASLCIGGGEATAIAVEIV